MRRFVALLSALLIAAAFTACGKGHEQGSDIIHQAYFCGKVIDRYDASCLLEVTDPGNQNLSIGTQVVVNTQIDDCPEFAAGDYLRIVFDGTIAESYPLQILQVHAIQKTDNLGNHIP